MEGELTVSTNNRVDLDLTTGPHFDDVATVDWGVDNGTSVTLQGTKTMKGNVPAPQGTVFTFELYEGKKTVFTEEPFKKATVTSKGSQVKYTVSFGSISYTQAGTYYYTVREKDDKAIGVTYDNTIWDVTVQVTAGTNGKLSVASVEYTPRSKPGAVAKNTFVFENVYRKLTIELPVFKTVAVSGTSNALNTPQTFTFTLTSADNQQTYNGTATVSAVNTPVQISWRSLPTFTSDDIGKTFTYTLTETPSTVPGMSTMTEEKTVSVTIGEKDGELAATVKLDGKTIYPYQGNEPTANTDNTITNTYREAQFTFAGSKSLTGAAIQDHNGNFKFTVVSCDAQGTPLTAGNTGYIGKYDNVSVNGDGSIAFPTITVHEPGTYYFLITENDTNANYEKDNSRYIATVIVNDDMTVTGPTYQRVGGGASTVSFTNIYKGVGPGVTLEGEKTMDGEYAVNGFTFKLQKYAKNDEGEWVENGSAATKTSDASGKFTFADAFGTFNKNDEGKTYYYRLWEHNDGKPGVAYSAQEYWFKVSITPNSDSTLKVQVWKANNPLTGNGETTEEIALDSTVTGLTFENKYYKASAVVGGSKKLTAQSGAAQVPNKSGFKFELTQVDEKGASVPGGQTRVATSGNDGNFTFEALEYVGKEAAKTYYYQIKEVPGSAQGVTYAGELQYVMVKVTVDDSKENNLAVSGPEPAAFDTDRTLQESGGSAALTFTNHYAETSSSFKINGTKSIEYGYNPNNVLVNTEFTYVLEKWTGSKWEPLDKATTNGKGDFTLESGKLIFKEPSEAGAPYTYRVYEKKENAKGITYDASAWQITIAVSEDGNTHDLTAAAPQIQKGSYNDNTFIPEPGTQPAAMQKTDGTYAAGVAFKNKFDDDDITPEVNVTKTHRDQTYEDGTVEWELNVDLSQVNAEGNGSAGQTLEDFQITDTVTDSQGNKTEILQGTVSVICEDHETCPALQNVQSKVDPANKLTIDFGNVTGPHKFKVKYKTVSAGGDIAGATNNRALTVENNATVTYHFGTENPSHTVKDEVVFHDLLVKRGEKVSVPVANGNAVTAIKWTLELKLSKLPGEGNVTLNVSDTLPEHLTYMQGKTTLTVDDAESAAPDPGETSVDGGGSKLAWTLTDLARKDYVLTYYTELEGSAFEGVALGSSVSFTNSAVIDQGKESIGSDTTTVTVENKLLSKKGVADESDKPLRFAVDYAIKINQDALNLIPDKGPDGSAITDQNLVLRDTLPNNANPPTAVQVYYGDTNTIVTGASWHTETQGGSTVLVVSVPDEKYVTVKYTLVVANEIPNTKDPITLHNEAKLIGSYTVSDSTDTTLYYVMGSATATGVSGTYELYKQDGASQTALQGAEFSLYRVKIEENGGQYTVTVDTNPDGTPIPYETQTSDENGRLIFGMANGSEHLALDALYFYVENKAPQGYQLSTERHYFMLRGQYTTQEMQKYLEKVIDSTESPWLPESANDVAKFAVNAVSTQIFNQKLETSAVLHVEKTVESAPITQDEAGLFSFVLKDAQGNEIDRPNRPTNDADGKASFKPLTYSYADLDDVTPDASGNKTKTYTYTITEDTAKEGDGKYHYDTAEHTATVELTFTAADNTLTATVKYDSDANITAAAFNNLDAKTELEGRKLWNDGNLPNEERPEVKLTLYRYVSGKSPEEAEPVGATPVWNKGANNEWTWKYTDLDKYAKQADGSYLPYIYFVEESAEGYLTSYDANGLTITNTQSTRISGQKTWAGKNARDPEVLPDSITVQLLQNGAKYGEPLTVTAKNNWAYAWDNLPKYDPNGDPYTYTVEEDSVPGYTTSYDDEHLNITNTLIETEVSGAKTWVDAGDKDDTRPEEITVRLFRNRETEPYAEQVVKPDADGNWTYSFTNLPKTDKTGKEFVYTVKEVPVPGYKTSYDDALNITNTLETTKVKVVKAWQDEENLHTIRPDSITVQLYRDDEKYEEPVKITADDGWTHEWSDLPKYQNGSDERSVYTVTEEKVNGYDTEIKQAVWNKADDVYEIAITNTLILTQATVTKNWVDGETGEPLDAEVLPDSITVRLLQNGEPYEIGNLGEVTLTAEDNWTHTWTGLPKFDADGVPYTYTVVETDIPDGYTVRYGTAQPGEETPDAQAPAGAPEGENAEPAQTPAEGIALTVTNTLHRTEAAFTAKKVYNGVTDKAFTFELKAVTPPENGAYTERVEGEWDGKSEIRDDGGNLPLVTASRNVDGETMTPQEIDFGATFVYTEPGTYYYTITEKPETATAAEGPQLVNDPSTYLVKVEVTAKPVAEGAKEPGSTLQADVTYTWLYEDMEEDVLEENVAFYNNEIMLMSLDGGFVKIRGEKRLESDGQPLEIAAGQFRFNLYPYAEGSAAQDYLQGEPLATAAVDANGTFTFYYSIAELQGTTAFAVVEQNAGQTIDGITHTDKVGVVTVSADGEVDDDGITGDNAFVNQSAVSVSVEKVWEDNGLTITHQPVTVTLYADGEAKSTVKVAAGETYTWENLPARNPQGEKIIYTVGEAEVENYTAEITEIEGEATYSYRITNTLNAEGSITIDPIVDKRVEGREGTALTAGEFTFQLADENGEVLSEVTNDADGHVIFDTLFYDADDIGLHTYIIREVPGSDPHFDYDETEIRLSVEVTRDEENPTVLHAAMTYYDAAGETETPAFVNRYYPVILAVQKTSKDGSNDPLPGAVYGLWMVNESGGEDVYLGNQVADENGYMYFRDGVQIGSRYYFKEEFAPDGHTVDEYPSITFVVEKTEGGFRLAYDSDNSRAKNAPAPAIEDGQISEDLQAVVLEFKNGAVGVQDEVTKLYVSKLDENTREPVTGAVLQIIEKSTGTVAYQWTSGTAAQAIERVLNVDTVYILREVTAPEGYDKAEDTEFSFDAYGNLTVHSGPDAEWVGDTTLNLYDTKRDVTITKQVTEEVVRRVDRVVHTVRSIPQTGDGAPIVLVASLSLCGILFIIYLQERKRANRRDK